MPRSPSQASAGATPIPTSKRTPAIARFIGFVLRPQFAVIEWNPQPKLEFRPADARRCRAQATISDRIYRARSSKRLRIILAHIPESAAVSSKYQSRSGFQSRESDFLMGHFGFPNLLDRC